MTGRGKTKQGLLTGLLNTETPRDPREAGGKAIGLTSLPGGWTPPFVVLGRAFHRRWIASGRSAERALPDVGEESAIQELLSAARDSRSDVIVRSNSPVEAWNRHRGRFKSVVIGPDRLMLSQAIDEVMSQGTASTPVFAVIQLHVRSRVAGHLSNERRVSERAASWLVEEVEPGGRQSDYWRVTPRRGAQDLNATDRRGIANALRGAAGRLSAGRRRVHCEWLWDGQRVWIVQRDVVEEESSPRVAAYLTKPDKPSASQAVPDLEVIRELSEDEADGWRKLRKPVIFASLGMPRAPIFFIDGTAFFHQQRSGYPDLREDLRRLLRGNRPLVVRCDLAKGTRHTDLNLPTSDPMTSADSLIAFMESQAVRLGGAASPHEWAFLPAWLVPARASVMVLARPGAQVLRLDALWGFPDGVGLLPHDTILHELPRDRIEARRRFKGSCLLWNQADGWTFERVPAPFDWKEVVSDTEVRVASSWARRLADHLQSEVQLMVLARIGGDVGTDAMLPWHYTDHEVPRDLRRRAVQVPAQRVVVISDGASLTDADLTDAQGILFRPTVHLRRDNEFIGAVGSAAADSRVPIYFEGSLLGHAYYVLRETGAEVVAVGQTDPPLEPDHYNKLVRDRIPEIIRRSGAAARVGRVDTANATHVLLHKLVEEAVEALTAGGDDLLAELADLQEVQLALLSRLSMTYDMLEEVRRTRLAERGGFDELVYLEQTSPDVGVEIRGSQTSNGSLRGTGGRRSAEGLPVVEISPESITLRASITPPLIKGFPLTEHRVILDNLRTTFRYTGAILEVELTPIRPPSPEGQLSLAIELQEES